MPARVPVGCQLTEESHDLVRLHGNHYNVRSGQDFGILISRSGSGGLSERLTGGRNRITGQDSLGRNHSRTDDSASQCSRHFARTQETDRNSIHSVLFLSVTD